MLNPARPPEHGWNSPVFMPICPAWVLRFFVCVRRRFLFRPHGQKKKVWPFFSPTTAFLAGKGELARKRVLRRFLRSSRGFWEFIFHARIEQKGEFPPCTKAATYETPTQTSRNQPKLPTFARFRTRQAARHSNRELQRKMLHKTHKTPAKPTKITKKRGAVLHTNRPIAGPPTSGRCLAGCGHSAVRSPKQKRTVLSQRGQNTRNGHWPPACVLLWQVRLHAGVGLPSSLRPSLAAGIQKDGQSRSTHPTECFTGGPYRRAFRARDVSVPRLPSDWATDRSF